jgi:hypothetical protein
MTTGMTSDELAAIEGRLSVSGLFVAHARTDVADLLAEVHRLRQVLAEQGEPSSYDAVLAEHGPEMPAGESCRACGFVYTDQHEDCPAVILAEAGFARAGRLGAAGAGGRPGLHDDAEVAGEKGGGRGPFLTTPADQFHDGSLPTVRPQRR